MADYNNGERKKYDTVYYSRFKASNYNTNTELNIRYSAGMMTLGIRDKSVTYTPGSNNNNNLIEIVLTGVKANILVQKMDEFEQRIAEGNISPKEAFGVQTGLGEISTVIAFHINDDGTGKAFSICKVNKDGNIVDKYSYQFQSENYYGLDWKDLSKMKFEKKYTNDIEYYILKNTIKEFGINFTGAGAYPVLDMYRYDYRSLQNRIDAVSEKLGIPTRSTNYSSQRSANNFFNGMNAPESSEGTSNHIDYDQMDDLLEV